MTVEEINDLSNQEGDGNHFGESEEIPTSDYPKDDNEKIVDSFVGEESEYLNIEEEAESKKSASNSMASREDLNEHQVIKGDDPDSKKKRGT